MLFGYKAWVGVIAVATLAACGGGGGGGGGSASSAVVSTNAFNVKSAMAAMAANGFSKVFSISGSCSGTFTISDSFASPGVTIGTTPAYSVNETATLSLVGCTSASNSGNRYYDMSYMPMGAEFPGNYSLMTAPVTFPTAAHVGDAAIYGRANSFSNNSMAVSTGSQVLSYSITADTATTAILTLIFQTYNSSNGLTSTEKDSFRISATNTLTPVGVDILYASGIHLVGN